MFTDSDILSNKDVSVWKKAKKQTANVFLRLLPLMAKLALTLYMGKFLELSDMGSYGIVFGTVMILISVLGQRFDYIVTREIVGETKLKALHKMRDQAILYIANCFLLFLVILILALKNAIGIGNKLLFYIFILATLEGYASLAYENLNARNNQLAAGIQFFMRAGLWIFPVVIMGVLNQSFRNVDAVLLGWCLGALSSYSVIIWVWRKMPWRKALTLPVNWIWMKNGLTKSIPVWIGGIGLAAGFYIDRYIAAHFLGIDEVGVITFYSSFNNALIALLYSGISVFSYPRLIDLHKKNQTNLFAKEARSAWLQVTASGIALLLALGFAVPILGEYTGHDEYSKNKFLLWLMLIGTLLRAKADVLFMVLYARHQDKPIWLGNLLFLLPAFLLNLIFVPLFGINGIGYSAICSALFLLFWRAFYVLTYSKKQK